MMWEKKSYPSLRLDIQRQLSGTFFVQDGKTTVDQNNPVTEEEEKDAEDKGDEVYW